MRLPSALRLSSLRSPALLERPGQTFRGLPAQRDEGPPDLRLFPFRPASLEGRGLPSVASSFAGTTVHWTLAGFRLTLSAPPFGAFTASLAERQQSPIADTGKFHILSAQTDDK